MQQERLAALGEMVAGLAHESRNALQRSQGCLERLRWKLDGQPEALDLVQRAQKAQDDLARLFADVRAYAGPLKLELARCDVAEAWREAWEQVSALYPGRQAVLAEETGFINLWCLADRFRLVQVFRNFLENTFAACADAVQVTISCQEARLHGRHALRIALRDNGPGLGAEQRQRIFEPFYTTKVRGSGLGMTIARRIVEAHGGDIGVGDAGPPGAEIVVTLPTGEP